MSNVPLLVDFIRTTAMAQHLPPDAAADEMRRYPTFSEEDIIEALGIIKQEMAQNIAVSIHSASTAPWYHGPRERGFWQRYRDSLITSGAPGIAELDESTTRITALLTNPGSRGQTRKGLVMGNVQSGKTRNFAGVIAKAADEGYRFVIVLAGMHNNLRQQTQNRLDKDIFWSDQWVRLTKPVGDFGNPTGGEAMFNGGNHMAAVVKKNSTRLENLINWLRAIPRETRRNVPVLIIDDEADQATPNSLEAKNKVSTLNRLLRELFAELPTATYVAYTATPYANVLINPDESADLFPSDFITTIPTGEGYFGAERVFGISNSVDPYGESTPGLDMIRIIPDEEANLLKPPSNADARNAFNPELPESLRDAVRWFLLATATRRARGQQAHSSMLVHNTHYAGPHFTIAEKLRDLLQDLRSNLDAPEWEQMWRAEIDRVSRERTTAVPPWARVRAELDTVIDAASGVKVIVDNGSSEDRLDYTGATPQTVIAVGGGTLSRGLTLEGLCVSYFTRTSTAYDTLLQMGRWFGYRVGYEDLPRLWVTQQAVDDYQFLALVEQDLRAEIESLASSGLTPEQVGVRIRTHPGRLEVTASSKMFHAKDVQLGLSGTTRQTFILDGSDPAITRRQVSAVDEMLRDEQLQPIQGREARLIARDIPAAKIAKFLWTYGADAIQGQFMRDKDLPNVRRWIEDASNNAPWNVVIVGNTVTVAADGVTPLTRMELAGHTVQTVNRAPLAGSTRDNLNFKGIMSLPDRVVDIDPEDLRGGDRSTDASMREARREHANGRGLLLIYPISGNSRPRPVTSSSGSGTRTAMKIDHDLLGLGVVFPYVMDPTGNQGSFISARMHAAFIAMDDEDDTEELLTLEDTESDADIDPLELEVPNE